MTKPMPESWRRTDHDAPDRLALVGSWCDVIELHPEARRAWMFEPTWSPEDPVA
ncbi:MULTISPECIES: hypothetical protein [unclassified Nocardioides]|uniref:hypothetical protein n=1 Tax=unclassified Nocardioides TaxID=2615069 RepID=UPI000325EF22|nr:MULTISPECIES: hypothetical protein [unclassified Nocardioides]